MSVFLLGPVLASVAFGIGFAYERRACRQKSEGWMRLLERGGFAAARSGAPGVVEGIATDGNGRLGPIVAPFTGRGCLAYHVEVIVRERHNRGTSEEIVWKRVYEDARGEAFLIDRTHAS